MAKVARLPELRRPSLPALGAALRDYARHELGIALEGLSREERVHAGVHEARKAIRRARAALALGRRRLGAGARLIDRALRDANRELSELRDAHALVEVLERAAQRAPESTERLLLNHAVRDARQHARRMKARHEPARRAAGEVVAAVRASLLGLSWEALEWIDCQSAIARAVERAGIARERARDSTKDRRWHRWRRRVRLLAHERRACAACGAAAVSDTGLEKPLAEQLGVAGEWELVLAHCGRGSPFGRRERAALRKFAARALKRQRRRIVSVLPAP